MEAAQQVKATKSQRNLKIGAKTALILIILNIVRQLATIYQTRHQLISPLIPESTIWQINKQFVFQALISAVVCLVGLLLYFFDKFLLVIALVILTLITGRFIYV